MVYWPWLTLLQPSNSKITPYSKIKVKSESINDRCPQIELVKKKWLQFQLFDAKEYFTSLQKNKYFQIATVFPNSLLYLEIMLYIRILIWDENKFKKRSANLFIVSKS